MWKIIILASFLIQYINGKQCQQSIDGAKVVPILSSPTVNVALSLVWDDCTQSVYFVDFFASADQQPSIYRYDNNEDRTYSAYVVDHPKPLFIIPIKGCNKFVKQFLVGFGTMAGIVEWDGISPVATYVSTLFTIPTDDPTISLAVGRQEGNAQGRFYVGTFHSLYCGGANNASFYEYSQEKGLQLVFTGTKTTTGVAFNNDATKIYHLDTCLERITGFDLDNGKICNGRDVYDFKNTERVPLLDVTIGRLPVGLDSDENGMLYTISSADGAVMQVNPRTGKRRTIAKLPVPGVGGVTFGGSDRKTLFAVVGSTLVDPFNGTFLGRDNGPSLYKIKCLGAKGHKYTRLYL